MEVDETLNKICECYDSSLNELGSHISAETKKSLQEIHRMAAVLNKLVSDKALAESDHTDDYKLLDNHIYEAENGEENENGNEEPDKNAEKEPEHTNLELKPVYQASLENQSLPNHKFEEKLPTEEDKPNEDAVTEEEAQEPAEVNENSDGVPKESSTKTVELKPEEKSMKSVKSEKGTPLFTEDPNFRTNHKGVPKSVSQYFSSTDVSLADEDEEDGQKVKKPTRQRLSVLSDSIKKPVTSLQSTNDKNNYNAVGGVLQILQVDPTEQPRTLEECNCQCRWQQAPLAMMVAVSY